MEERVHPTLVGLLLCCEDILDPGIHQQHHELHTQYSTAVPIAGAILSHLSLEAYSDSVHIYGLAPSCSSKSLLKQKQILLPIHLQEK